MAGLPSPEPRVVSSVKEIADAIFFDGPSDTALGKTVFLIGAGCSVSARVPGAVELAQRMTRELATRLGLRLPEVETLEAYRALVQEGRMADAGGGTPVADQIVERIDWYRIYDEMFARYYRTPDHTRDLFDRVVAETKGAVNWAHLCLGELAARRFVSTVLTTNFDQLVLSGMVRAGLLPVVCDGIESLNRIASSPRHPQLVELHGSRHTYLLRNRPDDVAEIRRDPQALGALRGLVQHATTFVVVGYGGREDGVMDLLIEAARSYPDKNLYWVQHSGNPHDLSPKARAFLATSRNGGLLVGQDADAFFLELCRHLGIGAPTAISQPLQTLGRVITDIEASEVKNPDIRAEIESAKARIGLLSEALARATRTLDDDIAAIRKLRLAGDHAGAYRLAEEVLAR